MGRSLPSFRLLPPSSSNCNAPGIGDDAGTCLPAACVGKAAALVGSAQAFREGEKVPSDHIRHLWAAPRIVAHSLLYYWLKYNKYHPREKAKAKAKAGENAKAGGKGTA